MYRRFYVSTSLVAVFINSLYCIGACEHYRVKFYFGLVIIIINYSIVYIHHHETTQMHAHTIKQRTGCGPIPTSLDATKQVTDWGR